MPKSLCCQVLYIYFILILLRPIQYTYFSPYIIDKMWSSGNGKCRRGIWKGNESEMINILQVVKQWAEVQVTWYDLMYSLCWIIAQSSIILSNLVFTGYQRVLNLKHKFYLIKCFFSALHWITIIIIMENNHKVSLGHRHWRHEVRPAAMKDKQSLGTQGWRQWKHLVQMPGKGKCSSTLSCYCILFRDWFS